MRWTRWLTTTVLGVLFVSNCALPSAADEMPDGWFMAGSDPKDYGAGVAKGVSQEGKASAYITATATEPRGFGTLMQTFAADSYRAKRVRMSAFVKSEGVEGWAGLWMRVDGSQQRSLSFDNMQDRPIKGTGDWQGYDIILDVPQESTNISFGILLHGKGKVYLDNVAFEAVASTVETTDLKKKQPPAAPVNLSFEN
jgi:hypothetical protein